MNNILAVKVLISHLGEINDSSYRVATEIVIETLFKDAISDWEKLNSGLSILEYLELTSDEYEHWIGEKSIKRY